MKRAAATNHAYSTNSFGDGYTLLCGCIFEYYTRSSDEKKSRRFSGNYEHYPSANDESVNTHLNATI